MEIWYGGDGEGMDAVFLNGDEDNDNINDNDDINDG